MQAAHHWDVLAEDVAKDVKKEVKKLTLQDPTLRDKQIYLEPNKMSLFGKVFDTLLITQLVNQKIGLTTKKESNSLKLKYGTQKVVHKSARHTSPLYPGEALLLTALGHGIYKAFSANSDALGLFAAAGAVEVINGFEHDWTVPHHEIVITTQLTKPNDTVIYRKSNIYYINDADFWHYANSWHNWGEEEIEEMPIKKYSCVSE